VAIARDASASLDGLARLEDEWLGRNVTVPEGFFGWEPYPLDRVAELLDAVTPRVPNRRFLDAGCGVGTKCALAAARGFKPHGIEWIPQYAAQARQLGVRVYEQDMREFTRWRRFGLVYLNHPCTSLDAERELEAGIAAAMAPGAVLIKVWDSLGAPPGAWETLLEVHEPGNRYHGAWRKAA
jgi:SAM-dependent methyltransferase